MTIGPDPSCLEAEARAVRPGRPVVLVSAIALVDADGRVLLARRPEGKIMAGLWEFPGGKVADGETPEAALCRELKEELDLDIAESCLAPIAFASHAYDDFHLLMPLFVCRVWQGHARPEGGTGAQMGVPQPDGGLSHAAGGRAPGGIALRSPLREPPPYCGAELS